MRGWKSGTLLGVGGSLLVISNIPGVLSGSIVNSPFLAMAQFIFVIVASIGAVFLVRKFAVAKIPDAESFSKTVSWILVFLLCISYLVLRHAQTYQISLSILVSMTVVVMGWWVQSILSAKASRRQHTLNTILNTRSSEIYQRHLNNYSRLIKDGQHLHPTMSEWFHRPHDKRFDSMKVPTSLRDAMNGLSYILNYFEFLALAIRKGDLDEALLRECFCGMLPSIEARAFHLIRDAQQKNELYYEAFVKLVEQWSKDKKSMILAHTSHPADADIGDPIPSEKQLQKMMAGEEVVLALKCYDDSV